MEEPLIYKTNASGIRIAYANPKFSNMNKSPEELIEDGWQISIKAGMWPNPEVWKWEAIKDNCIRVGCTEGFVTHWECIEDMTEKLK